MRILIPVGLLVSIVFASGPATAQVIVQSTFDTGLENWFTFLSNPPFESSNIDWVDGAGSPGGAARTVAPSDDRTTFFANQLQFPAEMRVTPSPGLALSFDLSTIRSSGDVFFRSSEDIVLIQTGGALGTRLVLGGGLFGGFFIVPPAAHPAYSHYEVNFTTAQGWEYVENGVRTPATQAQIDTVLANVATLVIRGEFWSGPTADTTFIDNVVLSVQPITVNHLNMFRDLRGVNDVGVATGDLLQYGADIVVGGSAGFSLGAVYPPDGFTDPPSICAPLAVNPDICVNAMLFSPLRIDSPWQLTFTNGTDQHSVPGPTLTDNDGAILNPVPFPVSVTVSEGATPTAPVISWVVPEGFVPDGFRVNIYDKGIRLANGQADVIHSVAIPAAATSYTVPAVLNSGQSLVAGGRYAINFQLIETRSHVPFTNSNAQILRRSNSFFSFAVFGGEPPAPAPTISPMTTIAGNGTRGFNGDAVATASQLDSPFSVAANGSGAVCFADRNNHRVRCVTGGNLTTIAGTGEPGYNGDNIAAAAAQLSGPTGVAFDAAGNLYIADAGNHIVRKVSVPLDTGAISTVAGVPQKLGSAVNGGAATSATLFDPRGVAVSASGDLYIADRMNQQIRRVDPATGLISAVAGVAGETGSSGDGGLAIQARLNSPIGVAVDPFQNVYIADEGNNKVRHVFPPSCDGPCENSAPQIRTLAGTGNRCEPDPGSADAPACGDGGAATAARLNAPSGVAVDANGVVYIADLNDHRVRAVFPCGFECADIIATVAGTGVAGFFEPADQAATSARLNSPVGVAVDPAGTRLHIADLVNQRIRQVEFLETSN
jgi:streptogramin lyase